MEKSENVSAAPLDYNGLTAAFVTTLGWGLTGIFVRLLGNLPPLLIVGGRLLVATIGVLLLLAVVMRGRFGLALSAFKIRASWGLALLQIGFYVFATAAFQITPVGEVTLLLSSSPLFVLAYKLFNRLPTKRKEYFGAALASIGIAMIVLPKLLAADQSAADSALHLFGDVLSLLSALTAAAYAIWFRARNERGDAPETLGVGLITFALGAAISLLVNQIFFTSNNLILNNQTLLLFLGLGVISTAMPTICYTIASRRLPPVQTTTISLLIPIFATIFALIFLREIPSPLFVPGSLFVLGGLFLMLKS